MSENTEVIELTEEIEVVGPGTMLREARLAKGLSQQVVAQRLNLRTFQIEQIESENFERNMPPTFTRGYLRNYAKLVDVCQEDVLDAYDHLGVAAAHANKMQSFSKQTKKETENRILMGLTYVILVGLMAMSGVWWYQQDSALTSVSIDEPKVQKSSEQLAAPSAQSSLPVSVIESQADTNGDDQQSSTKDTSLEPIQTASTTETSSLEPTELDDVIESVEPEIDRLFSPEAENLEQLDITEDVMADDGDVEIIAVEPIPVSFYFRGDCWVNIFDATGERIAWGVKKADYTMNIKGIPPFKVTLGKPDLVSISFDGIPVDISQFSAGQIAKFELPLEEL